LLGEYVSRKIIENLFRDRLCDIDLFGFNGGSWSFGHNRFDNLLWPRCDDLFDGSQGNLGSVRWRVGCNGRVFGILRVYESCLETKLKLSLCSTVQLLVDSQVVRVKNDKGSGTIAISFEADLLVLWNSKSIPELGGENRWS